AACVLLALAALPRRAAAAPATKLVGHWRWLAGTAVVGCLALGMTKAVERSEAVASINAAEAASAPGPPQPARPGLPSLAPDNQVHRLEAVASVDPVESCTYAAHGLVMSVVAPNSFRRVGNDLYYEPPQDAVRLADQIAAQVGPTCAGNPWPEVYVV